MNFEIESSKYDNSNLFNMAIHQIGYIITAPLKVDYIIEQSTEVVPSRHEKLYLF